MNCSVQRTNSSQELAGQASLTQSEIKTLKSTQTGVMACIEQKLRAANAKHIWDM